MRSVRVSSCLAVLLGTVLTGCVVSSKVSKTGAPSNLPPENPDPTHLVWIKPGSFTMGSPGVEKDRASDESPQNHVTISHGFWMSKYETTQGEYQEIMGVNPSKFVGPANRPVEFVGWEDATNYCAKLTHRERVVGRLPPGFAYRLPTEAEWEYACRAGTTTRFGYGDDPDYAHLGDHAWYDPNSDSQTHPVGLKKPNAWGLYDMHGNVWEWCLDWYGNNPGGSATDPKGPSAGLYRMFRGGCWNGYGRSCRSAFRYIFSPVTKRNNMGFRVVLAPVQAPPKKKRWLSGLPSQPGLPRIEVRQMSRNDHVMGLRVCEDSGALDRMQEPWVVLALPTQSSSATAPGRGSG